MPGKIQFDLAAYQEAAHKYRPELLMLPIIGIKDTLQYMTPRPGIRYKESVAAVSGNAQFGPYKPSRSSDYNLNLNFRTLETFMGSVVAKFEPNSAISTVLGQMAASKGDGQMKAQGGMYKVALVKTRYGINGPTVTTIGVDIEKQRLQDLSYGAQQDAQQILQPTADIPDTSATDEVNYNDFT